MDIKICGVTNLDDARAAADAGADFLGFVLYANSPRAITPGRLENIAGHLDGRARLVGVFVNHPADEVARIAAGCGLHAVQLQGDECCADYAALTVPCWRAFRMLARLPCPAPAAWPAQRFVMDAAGAGGAYGGTGRTVDWTVAAELARRWPLMLAGGLKPDNIAEAVRTVRPLGVDVSGGVESAPGRKDHFRIREFIRRARGALGDGI